jgi:hypothetical protein
MTSVSWWKHFTCSSLSSYIFSLKNFRFDCKMYRLPATQKYVQFHQIFHKFFACLIYNLTERATLYQSHSILPVWVILSPVLVIVASDLLWSSKYAILHYCFRHRMYVLQCIWSVFKALTNCFTSSNLMSSAGRTVFDKPSASTFSLL